MMKHNIHNIHEFTAYINMDFRTSYEKDDLLTPCNNPNIYYFESAWKIFHTVEFITWLAIQSDKVWINNDNIFEYWFADFILYVEMDMLIEMTGV